MPIIASQLKPFQQEGAQFLAARTRALLADEPGCGKTAQVVRACEMVDARRVLVVCPSVGVQHWYREFRRWSTRAIAPRLDVVSYEQAVQIAKRTTERFDVLVLDECHFGKNPNAQRTKAVYGKGGLGWRAARIWSLSGTPAPNHAGELWPTLFAFGATKMPYEQFLPYYCRVDDQGKVRGNRPERIDELRAILRSVSLRRKKSDVLPELGAIDIQEWFVPFDPRFVSDNSLGALAAEQEAALRRQIARMSPDEILTYLAGDQEFATLRRYNALLKAPAVLDQVMFEIENGLLDKVVIYGYHKEPLDVLEHHFDKAGVGAALIHGGTPQKDRDLAVQEWKHPRGPRVMLASIIAAGVVLDFTEAHQGIMIELDYVPGNNSQAAQRMHRHGQTRPVTVRVAIGSEIDEVVSQILVRKTQDFVTLFDGGVQGVRA